MSKKTHKTKGKDSDRYRLSGTLLDLTSQSPPTSVNALWKEHLEIRRILQEISESQKKFENSSPRDDEMLNCFLDWCRKHGLQTNGVCVSSFAEVGGGFGLKADADLKEATKILTVPSKIIMSAEKAKNSVLLKEAVQQDPILSKMQNVTLAIYLLVEKFKGKDSFWSPYIEFLPQEFGTPLYFTEKELELLKGSAVFEDALKFYRNIARQFSYFHQLLGSPNGMLKNSPLNNRNFSFEAYRWAVSAVSTRVNLIPAASRDGPVDSATCPALIPFLDMANHRHGSKLTTDFDPTDQAAICYADADYKPEEQVFIFYGDRSNAEFLIHDGFVYGAENESDWIKIKLGLGKSDKLIKEKTRLLGMFDLEANSEFKVGQKSSPVGDEMAFFVGVFIADDDTIKNLCSMENLDYHQLISTLLKTGSKKKIWDFLKNRFELLYRGYSNSGAAVLNGAMQESVNSRNARLLIECEKCLLERAITFVTDKRNNC